MNEFQPDNLVKVVKKCPKSRPRIYLKRYKYLTEEEKEQCQPIPCEDMLRELKWKCNKNGTLCRIIRKGYYMHWCGEKQLRYLFRMKNLTEDDFIHIHNVRYIHQIQNIVKVITGKELIE